MDDRYRQRIVAIGEEIYGRPGIPRDDKRARAICFARNFHFFGAPAAYLVTVDRRMGRPQWADLGMYLRSLMLLGVEHGLATCPQECWAMFPQTVVAFLAPQPERMLFCGVAIGYEDTDDPANSTRSARAAEGQWLTIRS